MTAATAPQFGAGRFEVRGTLGAGGAGTVYRVYDHTLQREVALKLLRTASGRDLYRFKREFRALADIVHPNLVALHELQATEGAWFFTMELVEGESFIDWVRPSRAEAGTQRTRKDIRDAPVHALRLRASLIQLVDALLALHRASKLHRELKPANVLVTPQGRRALLDFGRVASGAEDYPEKLAVGTPVYMSPEQASDQTLTEASDWYSVGAMLYEALCGQRPFEGEAEQVMTRKQTEVPRDPRHLATGPIPADLARLCMQLLSPAPLARPSGLAILDLLGATPSQKTRDMVRTANPASFVGRVQELEELRRALTDTRTRGVTVLVRGKSGIGKSTLIRKFLRGLGEQVFVLEGRCFEREQVPFKMLDGIVDMLPGVIVALPPPTSEGLAPRDLGALIRLFPVMRRVKKFSELAMLASVPADPGELRRRGLQALLALSSVAARPLSVEIAARAAGVFGGHDEATQLAAERLATLRRIDGQMSLQPTHDYVRQAVLASLDLESRAGWHEALARAFEDIQGEADLDAQAVVEHWLAAGQMVNAAHHAVSAGLRAEEALAIRRAAELYEIAIAYGPCEASGQRDLLRKKANALACAGLLDEAAAVYGHAAEVLPDEESIDLQRLHIEALLRRGRLDEAVPAAAQLLAHIGVRSSLAKSSSKTRLAAQWFSSKLRGLEYSERMAQDCKPSDLLRIDVLYSIVSGLAFADPSLGRTLQAELLRAALECGEPVRVCLALAQEVCYASGAGRRNATAVEAVGAQLDALAARIGHPHMQGLARSARGIAAVMYGRWCVARAYLEAGLWRLRELVAGARWVIYIAESYWLQALFYLGDWRELARQGQSLLREALDRGDIVAQLAFRTGTCNMIWLFGGRADESRVQLAAAVASLPTGFALPHVLAMVAACNVALYTREVVV